MAMIMSDREVEGYGIKYEAEFKRGITLLNFTDWLRAEVGENYLNHRREFEPRMERFTPAEYKRIIPLSLEESV